MKIVLGSIFLALCFLFPCAQGVLARDKLTFWTTEVEKDRMDTQGIMARDFLSRTGVKVNIVPVEENLLSERVTAAYAARALPDVIYHPIDYTIGWAKAGILAPASATDVIKGLKRETFGAGPLDLVRINGGFAAVPVDAWGQLLLYRKDLFKAKGLSIPDRWDNIVRAAQTLHNPPLLWGFEGGTDPGQKYTQQVFEHFALSNGVRLVDAEGRVHLNTPEMIETLLFYKSLIRFSPPGNLYWLHTRMDYLSGRAAMIVWSPFILDELSGLRRDQPVLPDLSAGKPGFLARNTGFVSTLHGPRGAAQYGQANYFGITRDADHKKAAQWITYLLREAYLQWLSMAPEGKFPVRKGTPEDPDRFVDGWMDLEFGVTRREKISRFYERDVVNAIRSGMEQFDRWGFSRGKGELISKIYGTNIIPQILKRFIDGEMDAHETARLMHERVTRLENR
ncbi:MAG: extracellular solute-binding protein [Thermodesulfobacteriota bacterium]|nr:extracellular solute-binding protein [Thermodesulfobacteriota bacterium]